MRPKKIAALVKRAWTTFASTRFRSSRLIPRKLSVTFDYFGAPGHYLHTSNFRAFDETSKLWLGIVETFSERLILLFAIVQVALAGRVRRKLRVAVALPAALFAVLRAGWLGYLGFVAIAALSGKELLKRPLSALAASLVLSTAATHALFFGAGRYGFVCAALLCLAAVGANAPDQADELRTRLTSDAERVCAPGPVTLLTVEVRSSDTAGRSFCRMPLIETEEAARRLARAIASDLSLYNEEKIIRGIEGDSLFDQLGEEIEEGRALFKSRVSPDLYHRNFYDRALVDILVKSKGHIKSKIW